MTNIENLISNFNKDYIKKLELEKVHRSFFNSDGDYVKINYDVSKDLENKSSEIYEKITKILEDRLDEGDFIKDIFVSEVIQFWIAQFSYMLKENSKNYFVETLYLDNTQKYAINLIKAYDKDRMPESVDEIINQIEENAIHNAIIDDELQESLLNSYLDDIEYTQLTKKLYDLEMGNVIDILDEVVNNIFYDNLTYDVMINKDKSIYLNIMPFQDGNDEGSILGAYLDYLGTTIKDDEYSYHPYYIHKDKAPKMPECFKWFMKSQGYDSENTIDLNDKNRNKFLESLRQEILNEQNSCQFLVFCIMVKIDELFKILNGQTFTIDSGTVCGFANIVHGSASGLNINLEKDIDLKINKDNCIIQVEGPEEGDSNYGYGYMLSDIWGFWEGSYSDIEIKE